MKKSTLTKCLMLLTVIFMDLLAGMEFDLFVPSFPLLQSHFGLSSSWVEALLSINFVGFGFSLFFVGDLADRYGRKPIILLGLSMFIMGSLFCLLGGSYALLLAGRFFQGMGIAAPAILSFLIIADSYPIKEQQFFMAMLNGVMNTAVAASPIIGSYITLHFHWQGNFMALLLLGFLVFLMSVLFLPAHQKMQHQAITQPIGYLSLLKSKPLMLLIINLALMCVPYWIFVGMSPILYIKDLGVSLSHFGYYQGVLALVFALGSVLFGFFMRRFAQRKMLLVANQICIASLLGVAWITLIDSHNPLLITLSLIPFIISQVIPSTILYPICLNFIPDAKGRISALLRGALLLLSACSLPFAGYVYQGSFQNIGLIISIFILLGIITLFMVVKNDELMKLNV